MSRPADISPPALIAILGAGRASRFGADKLVQPCAGRPLGAWALLAAQELALPCLWIAGSSTPDFVDCEIVTNASAAEGLGTSVSLAAQVARRRGFPALLVMLADMPLVTPALLRRLIAATAPAACDHDGRPGVPALVPAHLFGVLEKLTGEGGAAAVLRGEAGLTLVEATPDELLDVDTPAALILAEQRLQRG